MASAASPWVEGYDPASGRNYFYNSETGESAWDKPDDFEPGGASEDLNAATKIQSVFRGRKVAAEVPCQHYFRGWRIH